MILVSVFKIFTDYCLVILFLISELLLLINIPHIYYIYTYFAYTYMHAYIISPTRIKIHNKRVVYYAPGSTIIVGIQWPLHKC